MDPKSDPEHHGPYSEGARIQRSDTGIRILLTLLMLGIWAVIKSVLGIVIVFCFLWTLITREAPPYRLRAFSSWVIAYSYEIWRYIAYNQARVPFPFSDFPSVRDEPEDLREDEAHEVKRSLNDLKDARAQERG